MRKIIARFTALQFLVASNITCLTLARRHPKSWTHDWRHWAGSASLLFVPMILVFSKRSISFAASLACLAFLFSICSFFEQLTFLCRGSAAGNQSYGTTRQCLLAWLCLVLAAAATTAAAMRRREAVKAVLWTLKTWAGWASLLVFISSLASFLGFCVVLTIIWVDHCSYEWHLQRY